jgi:tetratricopeptide (TPR) repeat protein
LINIFKQVEKADPDNYYALWKIGNYHILMGAAHAEKRKEKKYHYREAVKYCERAMYTNEDFKHSILEGADITEASNNLTLNEIDAMGYWYTARFYYFSECLRPLGRVINTRIVIDNNKMIEQIDQLDPNWAGGGNYFSRGLYYIAVPERFGGSKQRAGEEFGTAIEVGPDYLVNRWGRAKYLYQLVGDEEGFITDLEWVLEQDPHQAGNPYPWNVYFQENARELLADHQHQAE